MSMTGSGSVLELLTASTDGTLCQWEISRLNDPSNISTLTTSSGSQVRTEKKVFCFLSFIFHFLFSFFIFIFIFYFHFLGWFGPTKEQKKSKADFEKWQKKFNERSPTGRRLCVCV